MKKRKDDDLNHIVDHADESGDGEGGVCAKREKDCSDVICE